MAEGPGQAGQDRPGRDDSERHLMEAARPVAALAARLGEDSELAAQFVHAAHEKDTRRMEELFRDAGVHGTVTMGEDIAQKGTAAATRTRTYGISIDVGPFHLSIKVEVKK